MTKVFIIPLHVKPMKNSIMPPDTEGAYVSCYSQGETYIEATERVLKKLDADGLYLEEILQPINEMKSNSWSEHVKHQWEDYYDNLPTQEEFNENMSLGSVVYGPFGSYNSK